MDVAPRCNGLNECAYCIANKKGSRNIRGHRHYRGPRPLAWYEKNKSYMEYLKMKREDTHKQKKQGSYVLSSEPLLDGAPTVDALMGDAWWDDGKPRQVCTLRIELLGGGVQLTLVDAEGRRSCHTTAGTVEEALSLLEGHLAAGGAPWRPWGPMRK